MRKEFAFFFAVLVLGTSAHLAHAQGLDGTLRGDVKDPAGAVVVGAKVTITSEQTDLHRVQETTSGGFNFPNLLVGKYTITVEHEGFKKYVVKGIEIKANQVTDIAAQLELGLMTQTVEVTSSAELVQTTSSQLGTSWGAREASDVPLPVLSGNTLNLSMLQVGTTSQSGGVAGVGGAIGGNRPRNNSFVVDGVDNNDVSVTGPVQYIIPEAVGEFTLLTNQFSAEYGHSTAGQFIANTKSGTNEYHGEVFGFVNNRNFNSLDNLTKAAIARGDLPKAPRFDWLRTGGAMGGPVIREKLFFFGAYQYATQGQASTPGNVSFVPTANGVAALNSLATTSGSGVSQVAVNALTSVLRPAAVADPGQNVTVVNNATGALVPIEVGALTPAAPNFFTQHDFQTNGDINLGDHRISLRFAYDRFRAPLVSAFPLPVFTGGQEFDAKSATASDVYSISPTIINEFRAGYRRSQFAFAVPDIAPPGSLDVYPNLIIEQLGGLELGPDGNSPQSNTLNQYQWVDNLSISRGAHNFKLGADARLWIAPGVFLPRERAEYRYSSLDKFVKDAVPDNLALRGVGDGSFAGNQKGIFWFIQDDWKLHPRLTLNLGLRYEFVTNPRDDAKQTLNSVSDLQNPTNPGLSPLLFRVPRQDINNFAPRIGFAWDMFGDHKTAMRGGFALAYDVIFQNLASLQLPPQLQQELGVEQACVALSPQPSWCPARSANPFNEEFIVANGTNFLANAGLPGTFIPQTLSPADARAGTQALIVDTVAPKTLTWSLGVQRELGQNNALEVRYVGTRGTSLPAQIRRNAALVPDSLFLPTYFSASDVPANVPITAPSVADFQNAAVRPYAADGFLSNVTAFDPASSSTYHGGSIQFTRRFQSLGRWGNGLFLRTGYTFSKTIDNATNELFTSQVNPRRPQDFVDLRDERGRSTIDHPHKFTIAAIYEFPKYDSGGWLGYVLNQWQVSASYIAESGQPVTALSFVDANGNGDAAGDRAIFNPGFTTRNTATGVNAVCRAGGTGATSMVAPDVCGAGNTVGYVAVNPAAQYVQALPGARTNVGRNTLDSPGLNNWNMSFFKKTRMTERVSVEFRADMQNVFNHGQPILGSGNISGFNTNAINGTDLVFVGDNPNFLRPQNVLTNGGSNSPFSGIVTGGNAGFRRFVQFGLKVRF
jgi:Carboxypeptidase regulatory-like domain/TonB dependent receptor-like, beta-barrel